MIMQNEERRFVEKVNEAIRSCESLLFITRCSDLQREGIDAIAQTGDLIATEMERAVGNGNEEYANVLLGLRCVVGSLIAELLMYIGLKEEDPDAAWNHLVSAQNSLAAAASASTEFSHCTIRHKRLALIETTMFPPQMFLSVGAVAIEADCSICQDDYSNCDHVSGIPYMGEFCSVLIKRADLDHVAIVDEPADKRCRIMAHGTEENRRNWMTLRREEAGDDS